MRQKLMRVLLVFTLVLGITLVAQAPANATVYFNCPSGVACMWVNTNGGGTKLTIAVGQFGYDTCWGLATNHPLYHAASSASADFGGGWDLVAYSQPNCGTDSLFDRQEVPSSRFENWGGGCCWFNDEVESFRIEHI